MYALGRGVVMKSTWVLPVLLLAVFPVRADPFSRNPRDLGPIVMRELSIEERKLVFRVDSGGCTDAASFAVDVKKQEGLTGGMPHYRLTVRRVRADECKAMLWEGVVIELDLEKDVGLAGSFTVSVENPVVLMPGVKM
jgi:hypothetical protein